jgi:hypothetical protein
MSLQQTILPFTEEEDPDFLVSEREYEPCTYKDEHDHLPVLFHIHGNRGGSEGSLGVAFLQYFEKYTYAYVHPARIFYYKKDDPNYLLKRSTAKEILLTYLHEFFHLYFDKRFDREKDTLDFKKSMKCSVKYPKIRSKHWETNERIVDGVASALVDSIWDSPFSDDWEEMFSDLKIPEGST